MFKSGFPGSGAAKSHQGREEAASPLAGAEAALALPGSAPAKPGGQHLRSIVWKRKQIATLQR